MKKLIIVSTKPDSGKGGISTALTGYIEGLKEHGIAFDIVESHVGGSNTLLQWFKAKVLVLKLAATYRSQAVFWFHCGPWLSLLRKFSLAIIARVFGSKTIAHIHSPTFNQYLTNNAFSKLLVKAALLPFHSLVVLTPWWEKLLREHGVSKPVLVSPNPNNVASCAIANEYLLQPRRQLDKEKAINILAMGRVVEGKGIETVIEAMRLLPNNYQLTVAGDGEKLVEYQALAKSLDVQKRVSFTGWVSGAEKDQLMRRADLFCLPSTYDSFGMVFIEAMAYELPVIAYGWGPIPDVVTQGVGVCCKVVTAEEVAQNIVKVTSEYERFQGKGPKRVLANYTPKVVAQKIMNLLS